ncbi:DUF6470 family protein [Brevibacillus brevis]|uniref:DUF6470 family protein n=1 Tax=Brevibacillus brevis TaxID=1393 RepID=A0ABY9T5G3_BREBE|nr:DUF6470 family protein [Brevibacillus brevis]WNC14466.1 DUF6470 family protein [Brevibacillus brevis]
MQIPQLRMESTFARLGLKIQKPVQEIKQPHAELNLRQVPADLRIEQAKTELTIDSSKARANIGIMTSMQFSDKNVAYAQEQWLQAISDKCQEGDRLMKIYTKENAIAEIGREKGMRVLEGSYTPPSPSNDDGVDVNIQLKPAIIDVKRNGMRMDPVTKAPEHTYTPGKVEPYMLQYNSLKIEVVGGYFDRMM